MIFPTCPEPRWRLHLLPACIVAILLALLAPQVRTQTFDATALRQPTDLGMNWLMYAGDDPAYAQANFDDSHWTVVDPGKSLHTYFRDGRPEVVWYRLHVKVGPKQTGLALAEWNLSSAFEIYVNGQKIMQTGQVRPFKPYVFSARLVHRIPDAALATGSMLIALRVHISRNDWINGFPGLYATNLTLGQEAALNDHLWLLIIGENALEWFYELGGLGLGMIALALYTAQPQQREYFWIFLLFLFTALNAPLQLYGLFHNLPVWTLYVTGGFSIATIVFQTLTYLAFLRMKVARWMRVLLVLAAAGILVNQMQTAAGAGSPTTLLVSLLPELALLAGVIPILLIVHWWRGNREAGILLIPALVSSLSIYAELAMFLTSAIPGFEPGALVLEHLFHWSIGPLTVNLMNLSGGLFVLSLAIIIVLRSTRIAQQQAQIETELAAAREVQKILLPERIECVPGFEVEAVYQPAQQVGGDFFQILPAANGSLLLVIGDVAGKGLPAAMLVSVLVGAIRGVTEYTAEPAELLANLNNRLVSRASGSLSTALAARIFADGEVLLANAGHLPPYLDGMEVDVPGALPLGVQAGMRYETVRFLMPSGSRLAFYSDGIVEAQNAAGELFGFERSRRISTEPVARIVEAARRHGQHDDITAISITRAAAAEARARSTVEARPALRVAS